MNEDGEAANFKVRASLMFLGLCKDSIYKIRNNAFLIIVYNHPTSLRQDQSVAIAITNFALTNERRTKNVRSRN